ncbi:uncharacterized protein LOC130047787 [Ostrea edulis]|uniref:uncharacterized protein LOC130047787 n=1 Tax=Ostrea edulis TaxID=37623 RepID=UPI0024AFEC42|nr:uncharacterized protein LOC130047787 [Ostrea edulis]
MAEHFHNVKISSENVTAYRTLRPGDQLAVEGKMNGIDYYHHGIFISHEDGIIDFGGENKADARVRQVDLLEFTGYGRKRLVKITYPDGKCLPPAEVVENAKKLLANPRKWGPYDAFKNNCEHFAMKCKTGIAHSLQVLQKLKECIMNPLQIFEYAAVSSVGGSSSMSGSSGSSGMSGRDLQATRDPRAFPAFHDMSREVYDK